MICDRIWPIRFWIGQVTDLGTIYAYSGIFLLYYDSTLKKSRRSQHVEHRLLIINCCQPGDNLATAQPITIDDDTTVSASMPLVVRLVFHNTAIING